jgi:hypothetical protein
MRLHDLYESDYNDDLRSEVITLLTAVSAEGIDEVSTQNLLNDLEQQGFAVDADVLMSILGDIGIVSVATRDMITIATSDADAMTGAEAGDIEADRVDNMATDQATKGLGEEEKDMRRAMGDPEFDYNEYNESIQRIRSLAGIGKKE